MNTFYRRFAPLVAMILLGLVVVGSSVIVAALLQHERAQQKLPQATFAHGGAAADVPSARPQAEAYTQQQVGNHTCAWSWIPVEQDSTPSPYSLSSDGTVTYALGRYAERSLPENGNSFLVLSEEDIGYGIAKGENVYWYGIVVEGADSKTFEPLCKPDGTYSGYFIDQNSVFGDIPDFDANGAPLGGYQFRKIPNVSPGDILKDGV